MKGLKLAADLTLPIEAVTETFAILANRGKGKSNTATVMVEELYEAGLPVVVLDVKGDWWGLRSSADGKGAGLPFIIFGGDHADVPLEHTAGALLADLVVDERIHAVLDMSHMSKTRARQFACDFAERLYHRNRDPLHLVIDEADVLIPQRATADTARLLGAMEDLAKRGRGKGIGLTVISQRGQEVAKSVLELMETIILLGMTGRLTIAAVKDWISVHVDETTTTAEVIASLPSLDVGEAWVWSPSFLRILKCVRIRLCATFDSHATPKPGQIRPQPKGRADIDLAALGERIAATVEKAKADDPKVLRARIAELERQLSVPVVPVVELREVPTLTEQALEIIRSYAKDVRNASAIIDEAIARVRVRAEAPKPLSTARYDEVPLPDRRPARPPARSPMPSQQPSPSSGGEVHLRSGARRIVETIARHHPVKMTVKQIGTLAKFKTTGGTWGTYWSEIRKAGLVEQSGNLFGVTPEGLAFAGVDPGTPMSTDEVLDTWRNALRSGARAMLDVLIEHYPNRIDRQALAAAVNMAATGGTFNTYLSDLRRNGLADVHGSEVVASDSLFLGAAS